ncbi:MAG TPA: hypothetical protein VFS43_42210, partial [Polyangiaceae bacterium]|nr:hypothetical protein [Polyangiaceae bacterium]
AAAAAPTGAAPASTSAGAAPTGAAPASTSAAAASPPAPAGAPTPPGSGADAPGAAPAAGEVDEGPLPAGALVPEGYGLLEVKLPKKSEIFVDRLNMGVGPQLSLPLAPGPHELRLRSPDQERPLAVTIRPGRRTALDLRGAAR